MRRIFKKYKMDLFHLSRDNFVSYLHKSPPNIEFVSIDEEKLDTNKSGYDDKYKLWHRNLRNGAYGLFAISDNKVVGWGWLKNDKSIDTFYRIGKNVPYLSEFFVDSDFRGKGIYPAMLSWFIISHPEYSEFYISAYANNVSSRKGLEKVGFKPIRSLTFIRGLKITLNKFKIV